jgi:hypothetical protein
LRVAFVTVGATGRMTGGYLYNARALDGLRRSGVEVEELVAGGADPDEQIAWAPRVGSMLNPASFDVIVVDALASIAVAPHLDAGGPPAPWSRSSTSCRASSAAGSEPGGLIDQRACEEPLLRADRLVAVSGHGAVLLEARGVPPSASASCRPASTAWHPRRKPKPFGVPGWCAPSAWRSGYPARGYRPPDRSLDPAFPPPARCSSSSARRTADPAYAASVRGELASASAGSVLVSGAVDDAALSDAYAAADSSCSRPATRATAWLTPRRSPSACRSSPARSDLSRASSGATRPCWSRPTTRTLSPTPWLSCSEIEGCGTGCPAGRAPRSVVLPRWRDTVAVATRPAGRGLSGSSGGPRRIRHA